jgi:hypothetical protein
VVDYVEQGRKPSVVKKAAFGVSPQPVQGSCTVAHLRFRRREFATCVRECGQREWLRPECQKLVKRLSVFWGSRELGISTNIMALPARKEVMPHR